MTDFREHPLNRVHTIDTAMNSLWYFYKKNFIVLYFMSAVMAFTMQYISSFFDLSEIQKETDPMMMLEKMKGLVVPLMLISLLNLLFTTILQHYILFKSVESSNNVVTSVTKSFRYYLPYLLILIMLSFAGSIAIIIGILAFVVGAVFAVLYIMTLFMFILPVIMVEETDIRITVRRVFGLAHRNFWSNFGWVATFIVILIAISFILSGIILLPFTGSFFKTLFSPDEASAAVDLAKSPLFNILSALVNALTFPLMPIFASILYFNAKSREGQKDEQFQSADENNRVRVEDLYSKPYSEEHPENPEKE